MKVLCDSEIDDVFIYGCPGDAVVVQLSQSLSKQ